MDATERHRTSARVLLFDVQGSVLLIRFVVLRTEGEFAFWATPGGTVEKDETVEHAARRELQEELAIAVKLFGPVHEAYSEFEHEGHHARNTDVFFVGRFQGEEIKLSGTSPGEGGAMRDFRWWSAMGLEHSTEMFLPPELPRLVVRYANIAPSCVVEP